MFPFLWSAHFFIIIHEALRRIRRKHGTFRGKPKLGYASQSTDFRMSRHDRASAAEVFGCGNMLKK